MSIGTERASRDVTDSPLVKAIARVIQILVLPIAVFIFLQVWGDIKEIKSKVEAFANFNSAIKVQVDMNEKRLERLEHRLEDSPTRKPQ